jgi:predicted amidohydrolase YtcJ
MERFADIVLRGGTVLTMDPSRPRASWLAVAGNRIVGLGEEGSEAWIGPSTRVVDLAGGAAIPGLVDTHTHLASNARDDRNVECRDFFTPTDSVETILGRLTTASRSATENDWIVGVGSPMQETRLRERRRPTMDELDAAVPDRPAYITFGGHILVANRRALDAAGIGPETADPAGGAIERDDSGQPNGVIRETAQTLIKRVRPGSEPDLADRVQRELEMYAARGVTTIHDIVKSGREVRAYQQLERDGALPVRVQFVPRIVQAEFETWSILEAGLLTGFGSDKVRLGGVKVSVDGGSSAGQAAFYPTDGDPAQWRPILRMQPDELDEVVERYHEGGVRLLIHAVGDLAVDVTLRSLARTLSRSQRTDHRHRVEHMGNWLLTPEQRATAKRWGIVPVPNPASLLFTGDAAAESMGDARMKDAYALRTILDDGFPLAFGSDGGGYWAIDPLRDIAVAVSRRAMEGTIIAGNQSITIEEGLVAQTRTAAWLGFMEDRLGMIREGMLADIAVLAGSPLEANPDDLRTMTVSLTIMDGRVVHEARA